MSQRVSITRQPFITSATITWSSCDLEWYTLLIDCSSNRGAHFSAHFSNWHICSISNGSRDNSSTMSQRVSITRQPFVTSATITWNSCDLEWYTRLIDCSSHRGAHFSHWHICSFNIFKSISRKYVPAGFHYSPALLHQTIICSCDLQIGVPQRRTF